MSQFKILYSMQGPGGRLDDIPNEPPVIQCDSLREVLEKLEESLPQPFGCECVKVSIEKVGE